jgi:acetate kinase
MANDTVLAFNCGSSSIKFAAFTPALDLLFRGEIEDIGPGLRPRLLFSDADERIDLPPGLLTHAELIPFALDRHILPHAGKVVAVGHRVVHGGRRFVEPVRVDDAVMTGIEALIPLARSHQPHNAAGLRAAMKALPGVPQVACFDTEFHRTLPELRQRYAIPDEWTAFGLRRYGFHGLSYEWIASRLPDVMGERAKGKVIVCHLGNGSSLAGLDGLVSRITSMGFTPLEGLMMGSRPGHLDPGAVLWLIEEKGLSAEAVEVALRDRSGLLGVSGLSSDMRELLASDHPEARFAVDMFVDRLVQEIGNAAAALGGLDGIVFTGGIGEHAAPVRAQALAALAWLGVDLDPDANAANGQTITRPGSKVLAHVVPTDEERIIARHTLRLVGARET